MMHILILGVMLYVLWKLAYGFVKLRKILFDDVATLIIVAAIYVLQGGSL